MSLSKDDITFAIRRVEAKSRYFVRMGRLRDNDADDVRQDVLLVLLSRCDEYDARRSGRRTWLNATIKHAFRFHFSSRKLMKHQLFMDIDALPEENAPSDHRLPIARLELCMDLAFVRGRLPHSHRSVFDLLGTHTITEISTLLGLSVGTVANRMADICRIARPLLQ